MGITYIAIAGVALVIASIFLIGWIQRWLGDIWENNYKVPAYAKDNYYYMMIFFGGIALLFEIIGFCIGI